MSDTTGNGLPAAFVIFMMMHTYPVLLNLVKKESRGGVIWLLMGSLIGYFFPFAALALLLDTPSLIWGAVVCVVALAMIRFL